jgi:hypothetical protein
MASTPNYASTPTVGAAILTAANGGSRAAPSGGLTIFSGGTNGGQVERIVIEPVATSTAATVQIYRFNGSNYYLYVEVALNAQTASASAPMVPQTLEAVDNPNLFPIAIPANWSLYAVLSAAQAGISIQAEGGTY